MAFKQAVKYDSKLRLALCGPAGSGKTYSLLAIAAELGGPIAYVDTEHGSASKYADLFQFDVIEPEKFDPRDLIELIKEASAGGYKIICIDSLSHYWMGKGGELDLVDSVARKSPSGNNFTAWKTVTPVHTELVDTIIGAQIHVLVSMRTKTEWVIEEDSKGRKVPRKIGLAPVMRDGIEFEFDVCGDLDQENTLTVTKSRCPDLSGKVINRPGKNVADILRRWLTGAPAPATKTAALDKPWNTRSEMISYFAKIQTQLSSIIGGDAVYSDGLALVGIKDPREFKNPDDAVKCYADLKSKMADMPAPDTSTNSPQTQSASPATTDRIGEKLAQAAATVASAALPASGRQVVTTPSNVVSISPDKAPWLNSEKTKQRAAMMGCFTGIAASIGKEAFESTLAKHELAWSKLSTTPPDSVKACECFREMEALEKAKQGGKPEAKVEAVTTVPAPTDEAIF